MSRYYSYCSARMAEYSVDKRRLMFLFTLFSVQLPFYINIFMQTFISFSVTKRAPAIIGPLYV